ALAFSGTAGTFNVDPERNRVVFRSGGLALEAVPYAVDAVGTQMLLAVPEALPVGPATAQVMSQFGGRGFPRGAANPVTILARRRIEIVRGDLQPAPAGRRFPLPLAVRVTDAGGAPLSDVPVYFSAPAGAVSFGNLHPGAPMGFFESGGGSTLTILTDANG